MHKIRNMSVIFQTIFRLAPLKLRNKSPTHANISLENSSTKTQTNRHNCTAPCNTKPTNQISLTGTSVEISYQIRPFPGAVNERRWHVHDAVARSLVPDFSFRENTNTDCYLNNVRASRARQRERECVCVLQHCEKRAGKIACRVGGNQPTIGGWSKHSM